MTRKQILILAAAFVVYEFLIVLLFSGMETCRGRSCAMSTQVTIWFAFFGGLGFVAVVVAAAVMSVKTK